MLIEIILLKIPLLIAALSSQEYSSEEYIGYFYYLAF